MALVVVESAAVVALDGPGVGGDGAVVVGDEIGRSSSDGLRELGIIRGPIGVWPLLLATQTLTLGILNSD